MDHLTVTMPRMPQQRHDPGFLTFFQNKSKVPAGYVVICRILEAKYKLLARVGGKTAEVRVWPHAKLLALFS